MEKETFTVISSYTSLPDAEIAKSVLESENIECWLDNKHMVSMNWFYSDLTGGIKLKVKSEDAEQAIELLGIKVYHDAPAPKQISRKKILVAWILLAISVGGLLISLLTALLNSIKGSL